jgi:hypothetical protein
LVQINTNDMKKRLDYVLSRDKNVKSQKIIRINFEEE